MNCQHVIGVATLIIGVLVFCHFLWRAVDIDKDASQYNNGCGVATFSVVVAMVIFVSLWVFIIRNI